MEGRIASKVKQRVLPRKDDWRLTLPFSAGTSGERRHSRGIRSDWGIVSISRWKSSREHAWKPATTLRERNLVVSVYTVLVASQDTQYRYTSPCTSLGYHRLSQAISKGSTKVGNCRSRTRKLQKPTQCASLVNHGNPCSSPANSDPAWGHLSGHLKPHLP